MRKIQAFTLFFLLCFSAKSSPNCSEIYFRLYNGYSFTISIDGQQYKTPCNNFRMNNVFPGGHYIQIQKVSPISEIDVPISQNGYIDIPASSRVYLLMGADNRIMVSNIVSVNSFTNTNYNGNYNGNYTQEQVSINFPSNNSCHSGFQNYKELSEGEFEMIKKDLKEVISDFTRLSALKEIIYHSRVNSQQVGDLMLLFSFDKDRLSLAKFAYPFTSDPKNYAQVSKSFIFNGTAQELWYALGNGYRSY